MNKNKTFNVSCFIGTFRTTAETGSGSNQNAIICAVFLQPVFNDNSGAFCSVGMRHSRDNSPSDEEQMREKQCQEGSVLSAKPSQYFRRGSSATNGGRGSGECSGGNGGNRYVPRFVRARRRQLRSKDFDEMSLEVFGEKLFKLQSCEASQGFFKESLLQRRGNVQ